MYYEVHGSGEPVVLLHGAGGLSGMWHELGWVEALSQRYQVIVTDARAFG
jgi:pimeloyl-ACP methyl ester carboxylesterase